MSTAADAITQVLAANVRRLRAERGLTQEQLGTAIGCSKARIGLLETGRRNTPLPVAERLAEALQATVRELLDRMAS